MIYKDPCEIIIAYMKHHNNNRIVGYQLTKATVGLICCHLLISMVSGSPIIQDGKLIGAVTHVLISDPTKGYGIFIENMLAAAE